MSMAASFLVSTPSSTTFQKSLTIYPLKNNLNIKNASLIYSKQQQQQADGGICNGLSVSKRSLLAISLSSTLLLSVGSRDGASAAILEADDDLELLEKVKKDRQKRIDRQLLVDSSKKETEYLQDVVYKLSKAGEAIDKEDMAAASSVLGDAELVKKANLAFIKLSSSSEERTEAEAFNSSIAKLITSVSQNDIQTSKQAFVSSATALEKWVSLTGLASQIKGL
ncbi:hypothetical protein QQ045_021284 [Rhodiola kirilowii]